MLTTLNPNIKHCEYITKQCSIKGKRSIARSHRLATPAPSSVDGGSYTVTPRSLPRYGGEGGPRERWKGHKGGAVAREF